MGQPTLGRVDNVGATLHSDSLFCILLPSQVTHYRILCGLIGKMETSVQRRGG